MTSAQPAPASEAPSTHDERPVASLSYEQARAELVDTVRQLEAGAASLEESLALWERGEALADHCEEVLANASERIAAATESRTDGAPGAAARETSDIETKENS